MVRRGWTRNSFGSAFNGKWGAGGRKLASLLWAKNSQPSRYRVRPPFMIHVSPLGGTVYSLRSGGRLFTIDLAAHDGNGSCTCPIFINGCLPVLGRAEFTRCDHILLAREYLIENIIRAGLEEPRRGKIVPMVEEQRRVVGI